MNIKWLYFGVFVMCHISTAQTPLKNSLQSLTDRLNTLSTKLKKSSASTSEIFISPEKKQVIATLDNFGKNAQQILKTKISDAEKLQQIKQHMITIFEIIKKLVPKIADTITLTKYMEDEIPPELFDLYDMLDNRNIISQNLSNNIKDLLYEKFNEKKSEQVSQQIKEEQLTSKLLFDQDSLVTKKYNIFAPEKVPVMHHNKELMQPLVLWQLLEYNDFFVFPIHTIMLAEPIFGIGQQELQNYLTYLRSFPLTNQKLFETNSREQNLINIGGSEASCGYHALKNAIFIIRALLAKNMQERQQELAKLLDITTSLQLFGTQLANKAVLNSNYAGKWREKIQLERYKQLIRDNISEQINKAPHLQKLRNTIIEDAFNAFNKNIYHPTINFTTQNNIINLHITTEKEWDEKAKIYRDKKAAMFTLNGDWLNDDEMKLLITEEKKPQGLLYQKNINFSFINEYYDLAIEALKLQNLDVQLKTDKLHAVIVIADSTPEYSGRHWLSVVINRTNKTPQYIIADSENASRYAGNMPQVVNENVQRLIDAI